MSDFLEKDRHFFEAHTDVEMSADVSDGVVQEEGNDATEAINTAESDATTYAISVEDTPESHHPSATGLTQEELARLKRIARKRFLIALVVGMLMAVMGYFAGKGARASRDAVEHRPSSEYVHVVESGVSQGDSVRGCSMESTL